MRGSATALALALTLAACGSGGGGSGRRGAGEVAAAGLAAALDRAALEVAPWRCATLAPVTTAGELTAGGRTWRRQQRTLTSAGASLTVAAVADARGATDPAWRAALRGAQVDLVVAVGGMGTTEAELTASLGALTDPAWLTVAIPGTAEAWPAHRAAVAALAGGGAAIVDGSDLRLLDGGAAVLATLPGAAYPERLAAASDGCVYDGADAAAIVAAARALAETRPALLATATAPQGGASDRLVGGVHAGDPALAATVAPLAAVLHAPVGAPAGAGERDGAGVVGIAAGSLDPLPRVGADGARAATAIPIVTIDRAGVRWRLLTSP
ncbi:MAG: hypothetical protein IPH44_36590 [Myxococcales bacterium]|nr:hypothetical protein [Myxococcales bacterium]MBK7191083.1 hypothetical protein [Myxococcales bacterium]